MFGKEFRNLLSNCNYNVLLWQMRASNQYNYQYIFSQWSYSFQGGFSCIKHHILLPFKYTKSLKMYFKYPILWSFPVEVPLPKPLNKLRQHLSQLKLQKWLELALFGETGFKLMVKCVWFSSLLDLALMGRGRGRFYTFLVKLTLSLFVCISSTYSFIWRKRYIV